MLLLVVPVSIVYTKITWITFDTEENVTVNPELSLWAEVVWHLNVHFVQSCSPAVQTRLIFVESTEIAKIKLNHIKSVWTLWPLKATQNAPSNFTDIFRKCYFLHSGTHLIVVDSEVGFLDPEVPLYNRPTLKPDKQLQREVKRI